MTFHPPSIPFLGQVIAYIYDFCTYRRKWNIRLLFEDNNLAIPDEFDYFYLRCINNTTYNIRITKIYAEESQLEIGYHSYDHGLMKVDYKNIEKEKLEAKNLNTDLDLKPADTTEKRYFGIGEYSERKNEARIKIRFKGKKTTIFVEYEIKDIQSSFFLSNIRIVKAIIPI